jgi:hypothetical protein
VEYQSSDKRKTIVYDYQKDQATGERKLKNWIIYAKGNGNENEGYAIQNAKVTIDDRGNANLFFDDGSEAKNQQALAQVDQSIIARAQAVIEKDTGEDILNPNKTPDLTIPHPYFVDKDGNLVDLKWTLDSSSNTISVQLSADKSQYPLALDPTLQFTAPGTSNSVGTITGEASALFGGGSYTAAFVAGDFNGDGRMDLAVGDMAYGSYSGRVYIFYNNGAISNIQATGANIILTGNGNFGSSLAAGDFNGDGKTDLAVGANGNAGEVYVFLQGSTLKSGTASLASITVNGQNSGDALGSAMVAGDFNSDGKTDLAVTAGEASSGSGQLYVLFQGSTLTSGTIGTGPLASVTTITGSGGAQLGYGLVAGDFNSDGKTDLAVEAFLSPGVVYVLYQGTTLTTGTIGTGALASVVTITGEGTSYFFGYSLAAGDFNGDGKTDLAVSDNAYSSNTGRTYVFYQGSKLATGNASAADVIITGETGSYFGSSIAAGDFNNDGKTDLLVGASGYDPGSAANTGRAYVFYQGSELVTGNATAADVIITGESSASKFGSMVLSGDFNGDGKTDIVVGAKGYSSSAGRAYIFYSQNGQVNTGQSISGGTSSKLGYAMAAGDFNGDGRMDLAVGAPNGAGSVYVFYNDGTISTTAATADVIITGEASSGLGSSMAVGDFNGDGKTDLAVGAPAYGSNSGRAYIFYQGSQLKTSLASAADVILNYSLGHFGFSMVAGDFNGDGITDLAISEHIARVDVFYGNGTNSFNTASCTGSGPYTCSAASANAIITYANSSDSIGDALAAGDFNGDGKTDLALSADNTTAGGTVYVFYQGSKLTTGTYSASTADAIITGEASSSKFGVSMVTGDFNGDGKTDLAVGSHAYSSNTGKIYIIYGGAFSTNKVTLEVGVTAITGETSATSLFGYSLAAGDFNGDGKTDLAVGAYNYNSTQGRVYIFYQGSTLTGTGGIASGADVIITGNSTSDTFGYSMASGDFNADGKTDLAVGAIGVSSNAGSVYIYQTLNSYDWIPQQTPVTSPRINGQAGQEVTITGRQQGSTFGTSMVVGDFNGDGKMDLAVSAPNYNSSQGRVYIFYNQGSIPSIASGANIIITGETSSDFGWSMATGDFNGDGKTDLAVGAFYYGTGVGRSYIFYQGSSLSGTAVNASAADVIISGQGTLQFGRAMAAGDFNADGKTDLAISGPTNNSNTGIVYVFYGGSFTASETTSNANVVISGGAAGDFFGYSLAVGDFNADGKTDLAVGAFQYNSQQGRAYIFYGGSSLASENASAANVIITGDSSSQFGYSITAGDFNGDGKIDLAVGEAGYSSYTGRAYIFYGGSLVSGNAISIANAAINGENTGDQFGTYLFAGDMNADGKTDLIISAAAYKGNYGKVYIYTGAPTNIAGGAAVDQFGYSMVAGDFNADGKIDLAVGAPGYNPGSTANEGRAYIFYNRGNSVAPAVASADVVITGEAVANSYFGAAMTAGDFNNDGKTDLAVGAYGYSTSAGEVYIFNGGALTSSIAAGSGASSKIQGIGLAYFGRSLAAADFNGDGQTDLAVGGYNTGTGSGRVYIFTSPSTATSYANANNTIVGAASSIFGTSMAVGDFNGDGIKDLAVGAYGYNSSQGRAYIFTSPTTATVYSSASTVITGENVGDQFGYSMTSGDFNSDGKTDLVVGANAYTGTAGASQGRAYVFNQNSAGGFNASIAATAANTIITGQNASDQLGSALIAGDFNQDGNTDLAVGAMGYNSNIGRVYIFYNNKGNLQSDSSKPGTTIDGTLAGGYFGNSMCAADFTRDSITDLAVGAFGNGSVIGDAYVFPMQSGPTFQAPMSSRGSFKTRGAVNVQ